MSVSKQAAGRTIWGGKLYLPAIVIPGYVGWDSTSIYLGCYEQDRNVARETDRNDFSMRDQDIFLKPWKDEYSFISHGSFIDTNARFEDVGMKDSKYRKAIEYEAKFTGKEWDEFDRKRKGRR